MTVVRPAPQPKIAHPTREDWEAALCRQIGTTFFYPNDNDMATWAAAKAVCRACPLEHPCLELALARNEIYGIWGGTSPLDRRRLKRQRSRRAA